MKEVENKGAEYDFYGKLPLGKAILLGLQHVFAMFVGNLTPLLIITGACGITSGGRVCRRYRYALLTECDADRRCCYV